MAVYINPRYHKGPPLERSTQRAKDGQTWQAGQFGRRTDSGVVTCKANASSIQFCFAAAQPTATSSSDVLIDDIVADNTELIMGVTNAGADTKALSAYIGNAYGLGVADSICTVSTGNDSTEVLQVRNILPNLEGFDNDTSDVPGFVTVIVPSAVRAAEGNGVT